MARPKNPTANIDITAIWPKLNEPDTKFDTDGGGSYSVQARFTEEEWDSPADFTDGEETVHEFFDARYAEAYKASVAEVKAKKELKKAPKLKKADPPYKEELDKDSEEPTGAVLVTFKAKGARKMKDGTLLRLKLPLFDSAAQPMSEEIWGGSKLRLNVEFRPWYMPALGAGVSLSLRAVQVLELVGPGQQEVTAEMAGFEAVEGGYVAPVKAEGSEAGSAAADSEDDDF